VGEVTDLSPSFNQTGIKNNFGCVFAIYDCDIVGLVGQ